MRIAFVLPRIEPNKFSGGLWCLMRKAVGLSRKGHEVWLLPTFPSPAPEWIDLGGCRLLGSRTTSLGEIAAGAASLGTHGAAALLSRTGARKAAVRRDIAAMWRLLESASHIGQGPGALRDLAGARMRALLPDVDATIATGFETALPVKLYGKGRRIYHCQHLETFFSKENDHPDLAEWEADQSYRMGLDVVANSTWLARTIQERYGYLPPVSINAVDTSNFHPPSAPPENGAFRVISYGGRMAVWKGFREMAEGVAAFRSRHPEVELRWSVYGDALLPPDNAIAAYESLGFLDHRRLNEAYGGSHCLLSASWYESYPLFPIEAMAAGLPVITSAPGTEDYAIHGENALVVDPHSTESILSALERMWFDPDLRRMLSLAGVATAAEQRWDAAIDRFESVLEGIVRGTA